MLLEGKTMIAKQYKQVLQKYFIPFYKRIRRKYGDKVVMQEDNAPQHIANMIKKYLANKKVNRMSQLVQSPNLNPIKNLWKYIKGIISKQRHKVRSAKEMRLVLEDVQPEIDPDFLLKLCDSVPKRHAACLKNQGGATKY